MGSALSLFNTTPDTWLVKIIPTTWNWTLLPALAEAVVNQINDSLRPGTNAELRLIPNNSVSTPPRNMVYALSGMTPVILTGMLAMANLPSNAGWASAFQSIASSYTIHNESCHSIRPGQSHRSEGHTLSLIRRGIGYRIMVDPRNPQQITMHLLEMAPIFSGPTAGSTNVYHMQDWINQNGLNGSVTLYLDGASPTSADASMSTRLLQDFTKACLEAKEKALKEAGKDCDLGICEVDSAPATT